MYTERVSFLIVVCAILILASLVLKDWRPLMFILPIASLFFLSNSLSHLGEINIEITQRVNPARTMAGGTATVRLEVVNKGKERVDFLEVYGKIPPEVSIRGESNHLVLSLNPGENVTATYEILCPFRGHYTIGPVYLKVREPLGFHFKEKTLAVTSMLSVLPEIEDIKMAELKPRYTGAWPGIISSRRSGVGTEFYGLRHYIPGDELKRVNWKVSARMATLITTEYESERVTDIIIILDACRGSDIGPPSKSLLEYEVKAAASFASLLLRQGNRLGLIIHGGYRSWLHTDFGKRQITRILNQLAAAKIGETIPLGYVVGFLAPLLLPPKSQIILVSPLLDPSIYDAVRDLAVAGYSLFIISPSFLGVETTLHQMSEMSKIAHRITALERRNIIAGLRKCGVVVDWDPNLPLNAVLKEIRRWHVRTRRYTGR